MPAGGGAYKLDCDQKAIDDGRDAATAIMDQLWQAATRHEVECTVRVEDGTTCDVLSAAVQRADLLICGGNRHANSTERSPLFSILKYSSRPVLVIPSNFVNTDNVLVAYDGSRPAARALQSFAASGLWRDRKILLLGIENGHCQLSAHLRSAAEYLERHDVDFEFQGRQNPLGVGPELQREIERLSIGMVVMGAFGKSSIHEFFLGSVTQTLLKALPSSLFLDH